MAHTFPEDCLSDVQLLDRLHTLVACERRNLGELLAHLAEVDRRRLYLDQACSSLFRYCTERLGLSEHAAYKRIGVARASRRFPRLLQIVADGRLHLAGLCALLPHLTPGNHEELLEAASGKTLRQVEQLVAARFPKPDVAASVRKLPSAGARQARQTAVAAGETRGAAQQPAPSSSGSSLAAGAAVAVGVQSTGAEPPAGAPLAPRAGSALPAGGPPASRRPRVEPLSASRYRIQFTAGQGLKDKLEQARALLSHSIAPGDLEAVFERALDVLIEAEQKRRFGARSEPRAPSPTELAARQVGAGGRRRSRHIPAAVRRRVFERDEGRCSYVDAQGRRCGERRFLQFEHRMPFALGGQASEENLCLLCAAHNGQAARRIFGAGRPESYQRGAGREDRGPDPV